MHMMNIEITLLLFTHTCNRTWNQITNSCVGTVKIKLLGIVCNNLIFSVSVFLIQTMYVIFKSTNHIWINVFTVEATNRNTLKQTKKNQPDLSLLSDENRHLNHTVHSDYFDFLMAKHWMIVILKMITHNHICVLVIAYW